MLTAKYASRSQQLREAVCVYNPAAWPACPAQSIAEPLFKWKMIGFPAAVLKHPALAGGPKAVAAQVHADQKEFAEFEKHS